MLRKKAYTCYWKSNLLIEIAHFCRNIFHFIIIFFYADLDIVKYEMFENTNSMQLLILQVL